jgi:hypothetical protein
VQAEDTDEGESEFNDTNESSQQVFHGSIDARRQVLIDMVPSDNESVEAALLSNVRLDSEHSSTNDTYETSV